MSPVLANPAVVVDPAVLSRPKSTEADLAVKSPEFSHYADGGKEEPNSSIRDFESCVEKQLSEKQPVPKQNQPTTLQSASDPFTHKLPQPSDFERFDCATSVCSSKTNGSAPPNPSALRRGLSPHMMSFSTAQQAALKGEQLHKDLTKLSVSCDYKIENLENYSKWFDTISVEFEEEFPYYAHFFHSATSDVNRNHRHILHLSTEEEKCQLDRNN